MAVECTDDELLEIVENILSLDPAMRFAAILDLKMREKYNGTLGKVRYIHNERENVTQIISYAPNCTIFVTMEPELRINKKLQIITKIKKMTAHL